MRTSIYPLVTGLLLLSAFAPDFSTARAQGTTFSYQGRLFDGANLANGNYDLRFTAYDAVSGGTAVGGPLTASAAGVSAGLFTVTLDFGGTPFSSGAARWLEIGVRPAGSGGSFTTLAPRQAVTATPYAITAGNVTGPINGGAIIAGSVGAPQLAAGAAAANLQASGQSPVPSGGLILSSNYNDANLAAAGYVKLGKVDLGDVWEQRAGGAPLAGRDSHTAVWTGSEMIVWGGADYNDADRLSFNDGARYNPLANTWTRLNQAGAPAGRIAHSAVWTGSEMLIWGGGYDDGTGNLYAFSDGGRYNPATDSWAPIANLGGPSARFDQTAVWTGTEMIIWGGNYFDGTEYINLSDGARYNPAMDHWTAMASTGAPVGRVFHSAVWTGNEMIAWGGYGDTGELNDGGRYDPAANQWSAVSMTGAPPPRASHSAVWTGHMMIIWGGFGDIGTLTYFTDGGRYDPTTDGWTPMSTSGAPSGRTDQTSLWTGTAMLIWGGDHFDGTTLTYFNNGARYDPVADHWAAVTGTGTPAARSLHSAVWTGTQMVIWGGSAHGGLSSINSYGTDHWNDGGRYDPSADRWASLNAIGVPVARHWHTSVWTGSELIIWGGWNGVDFLFGGFLNDGGRYDAAANNWRAIRTAGAPAARAMHTAVWTGSEMLVWGGWNGLDDNPGTFFSDGGRYNPAADTWAAIPTTGAPAGRRSHTAVWTGREMLVWGGNFYDGTTQTYFNDGSRYNPSTDAWTGMTAVGAPLARAYHTVVWTGNEMIVWGGSSYSGGATYLNDGGRYNPASNTWRSVPTAGAPSGRQQHSAVWTGNEMLVWGGINANYLSDGARYNPAAGAWSLVSGANAPSARAGQTAVWTGTEMLVWGGLRFDGSFHYLGDGSRYNPGANTWTPIGPSGAPFGRYYHTAVWTGSRMLVWGGSLREGDFNDTYSYSPDRVLYLYQRP